MRLRVLAIAAFLVLLAAPLPAQTLRGQVVEPDGRPVAGAMVLLLGEDGAVLGRSLTDAQGRYELRTPAAGRYRARAERVGFAATTTDAFELAAGETVERRIEAAPVAVSLGAVTAGGRSRCGVLPDEGTATALVWEEVRKALDATAYLEERRAFRFEAVEYVRDLDPRTLAVREENRSPAPAVGPHPFRSLPAARLSAGGYVQETPEGTLYFAPDARALLSEEFLRDHCLGVRRGRGEREAMVGLSFRPAPGRKVPEIEGTLWVDRATSELKVLEYRYVGLDAGVPTDGLGGRVEFGRAPEGGWIVRRWWVRMPAIAVHQRMRRGVDQGMNVQRDRRLAGIREQGGEVTAILAGDGRELAAAARRATLTGTVTDGGAPLAGATVFLSGTSHAAETDSAGAFRMEGVAEGEYTLSFFHPSLGERKVVPPSQPVRVGAEDPAPVLLALLPDGTTPAPSPSAAPRPAERTTAARGTESGFQERARSGGGGHFIGREQILRRRPARTADLFHGVPGLIVTSQGVRLVGERQVTGNTLIGRPGDATAEAEGEAGGESPAAGIGRDSPRFGSSAREGCVPAVFVDGRPWPDERADFSGILPEDIEGIEVYPRAALVPVQYRGASLACGGAILVWLRRPAAR